MYQIFSYSKRRLSLTFQECCDNPLALSQGRGSPLNCSLAETLASRDISVLKSWQDWLVKAADTSWSVNPTVGGPGGTAYLPWKTPLKLNQSINLIEEML